MPGEKSTRFIDVIKNIKPVEVVKNFEADGADSPEMRTTNLNTKGKRIKLSQPLALKRERDASVSKKADEILQKASSKSQISIRESQQSIPL